MLDPIISLGMKKLPQEHDFSNWIKKINYFFTEEIGAQTSQVSQYRETFAGFIAGFHLRNRNLLLVGIDEVLANITEHTYKYDKKKKIGISVCVDTNHKVLILVQDNGVPYNPKEHKAKSPKTQFAKGADGGYGLYLIKRIFYKIDYFSQKKINTLVLLFDDKRVKNI